MKKNREKSPVFLYIVIRQPGTYNPCSGRCGTLMSLNDLAKVGPLFTADQKKSGILASVSMAQFILESGYGKSELALGANNCFGMKKSLSGNTWSGSVWDGVSIYKKKTQEQKADGSYVTVTAEFRKYANVEDSIADHSAYLLGAKNGEKLRYDGLKGCSDYKKAVQIIKDGGYATSLTYVEKLCGIIERWNLTKWDVKNSGASDVMVKYYRVRKSWKDAGSQLGAYTVLDNAKAMAETYGSGSHISVLMRTEELLLYDAPFMVDKDATEEYAANMCQKIKEGSLDKTGGGIVDITGVGKRDIYHCTVSNGWLCVMTVPRYILLAGFYKILWYCGGVLAILFLVMPQPVFCEI